MLCLLEEMRARAADAVRALVGQPRGDELARFGGFQFFHEVQCPHHKGPAAGSDMGSAGSSALFARSVP